MRISVAAGLTAMVAVPQAVYAEQYTVWASVIFVRTGERTPEVLGFVPTTLTSLGAQQQYHSGAFFRERYIDSTTDANVLNSAPLSGLSADGLDSMQVYVQSLDFQWTVASAQAFLQGLYPPFTLNTSAITLLDSSSILANGSYVDYPLQGYQYAQIHASGALDADYPYIAGNLNCPAFNDAAFAYETSAAFNATQAESSQTYDFVGPPLLSSVLDSEAWDYVNAYAIYDYINYQYAHNATAHQILNQPGFRDQTDNTSFLTQLRFYADQQQWAELGNLTVENTYSTGKNDPLPGNVTGSISTIAGNMLAAKMLAQLQIAVSTAGEYYKLSLLFGDYDPLMSLFALTGLPNIDSNFYGMPAFGSVASFELFSYTNGSDPSFPSSDELWVRFYFRNGTEGEDVVSNNYQSYPIFNRGPSQTDMMWDDFQTYMYGIMVGDIGDWCTQCGADVIFCAAFNSSNPFITTSGETNGQTSSSHTMNPAIAGVIGAIIALAIAGGIFVLLWLIGVMSLHKRERRKSELGGFKGNQKLASDQDLTIPKGVAVVGASIEREDPMSPAHERVGSWELKSREAGERPNMSTAPSMRRLSGESERIDPFRDPVKPDERV